MPVEAKPLFRPDVVARRTRGFVLPERVEAAAGQLRNWAGLVRRMRERREQHGEQELLPDFLSDVFGGVLGYTGPASGGARYTMSREKHVEVEGEFVDAVLGEFGAGPDRPVVAVKGEGPKDPLDRFFGGRRSSAVEQGYRYATNPPCDWIVVTNIREIRHYHKGSDQRTYERFETERFATDEEHLRRFVYLLGAERVVPVVGESFQGLFRPIDEGNRPIDEGNRTLDIRADDGGLFRPDPFLDGLRSPTRCAGSSSS